MKGGTRVALGMVIAMACSLATACGLVAPLPKEQTLDQRLAAFPVRDLPLTRPVTIYWHDRQIPFVVAEDDGDAAFALGLVHAHLRLGQMAIYRRIAQGRIAEMGGPLAVDIDHGIRVLNFGQAADDILAGMPAASRHWLERFVAGVNHYQHSAETLPYEFGALNLEREPWTARDVVTFGRLTGSDVTWLVWFNLLALRQREDWPQIWARLLDDGRGAPEAAIGDGAAAMLGRLLNGVSRSGSNSLAVAPSRSVTGGAILANDPHLGLNLPNTWLIAGIKSPSYHAVGLMVPGLPVIAIGRNPWIAWGGTNMRASSSDLIDVSSLPETDRRRRSETIRVRGWFDRKVTVHETPWGPLVSDIPQLADLALPPVALRWIGHEASDEITAMLRVARARDVDSFRAAFEDFALPGQNMLYADVAGNIAHVLAVRVPERPDRRPDDVIVTPAQAAAAWARRRNVADLPMRLNPPEGFLASANNRPFGPDVGLGSFFSPDDRVLRMNALLAETDPVDLTTVRHLQQDVRVESSARLAALMVKKIDALGIADEATTQEQLVLSLLRGWEGDYRADSRQPVAFELLRHAFTGEFYLARFGAEDWAAFANVGRIKELLIEDIEAAPETAVRAALSRALADAATNIDAFGDWGSMHRLALRHPLHVIPLVGSRFRFADYPVGGSTDALMKTAHALTDERHNARYGSNARHISDLSDPDANHFVLLGGQDGWLNSTTFLDQVDLWRRGDDIQVPLTVDAVRRRFSHRMDLQP